MTRHYDPPRAKAHRDYDAFEISELLRVCTGTVHGWRKWEGLKPVEDRRPYVFSGRELARFLEGKNKPSRPLAPGYILCVACKDHRLPKDNRARVAPKTETSVNLIGECPTCGRDIYRRTRIADLRVIAGTLTLDFEDGAVPLGETRLAPQTRTSEIDE